MKSATWLMIGVVVMLAFSAHLVSAAAVPRAASGEDPELCPICEFTCQVIDGLLARNYTTDEIVLALEGVCALAPEGVLKTTCQQFLSNTLPVLLKALASGQDPEKACELVGACPAAAAAVIVNQLPHTARINN